MSGVEITQADRKAHLRFFGGDPDYILSGKADTLETICFLADFRATATAPLIAALEDAREALERLGLRELVAGWNGENRPDGPYEPHPAKLGVTLRTNAGTVYEIDATLTRITAELAKHKGNEDEQG